MIETNISIIIAMVNAGRETPAKSFGLSCGYIILQFLESFLDMREEAAVYSAERAEKKIYTYFSIPGGEL